MNQKNILLGLAGLLILVGLLKPEFSNILGPNKPVAVDVLELSEPTDPAVKKEADDVVVVLLT